MVLPEDLCSRLAELAEAEARTVSNMARVLIQQGVERHEAQRLQPHQSQPLAPGPAAADAIAADRFRQQLEGQRTRRLRRAPRRLRLQRPD